MAKVTPRPKWVLSSPKLVDAWSLQGGGRSLWGRGVHSHCLPVAAQTMGQVSVPPSLCQGCHGSTRRPEAVMFLRVTPPQGCPGAAAELSTAQAPAEWDVSWWGRMQTRHSSLPAVAQTGQAATGAWLHVPGDERHHSLPVMALSPPGDVPNQGKQYSPPGGDTAPSAPLRDCWGRRQQCRAAWGLCSSRRSQGHLLSPGASSGETKGGGGRAALFPLCRELLYKGSSDIIH